MSIQKNEENLKKAYNANNNNITLKAKVTIRNKNTYDLHSFEKVSIVLAISPSNSYIEIECKKKDFKKYKDLGLRQSYTVNEAVMDYEEFNDYQTSLKRLVVKPNDIDNEIIIRINPE